MQRRGRIQPKASLVLYTFGLRGGQRNPVSPVEICQVHLFNWVGRLSGECEAFLLQAFGKTQNWIVPEKRQEIPDLRKFLDALKGLLFLF